MKKINQAIAFANLQWLVDCVKVFKDFLEENSLQSFNKRA